MPSTTFVLMFIAAPAAGLDTGRFGVRGKALSLSPKTSFLPLLSYTRRLLMFLLLHDDVYVSVGGRGALRS